MLFKGQPKLVNIILNQRENKSQGFLNKALVNLFPFTESAYLNWSLKKKKRKASLFCFTDTRKSPPRPRFPPATEAVRKFQEARVFLALSVPQPQHDDSHKVGV